MDRSRHAHDVGKRSNAADAVLGGLRAARLRRTTIRLAAFLGTPLLVLIGLNWPELAIDPVTFSAIALALVSIGLLTLIDPAVGLRHPKNLVIVIALVIFAAGVVGFLFWRTGRVVARATFNPGIAPFEVTVREVPVPVTGSHHFIITLKRGQYPVTSFRYFWVAYTPKSVKIEWTRLETFRVIFDERYVATCRWSWGREATWTMQVPPGARAPGDQP